MLGIFWPRSLPFGDQLGFVSAVYPAGISALFAGKLIAAVAALIMALALVDAG